MILLAIPNWVNYIVVEMDKSVWGHRYEPHTTKGVDNPIMLGKYCNHPEKIEVGTTKIQSLVNKEERFFNDKMEIVTRDNRPYKAFALEAFLLGQEEEEKTKRKVSFASDIRDNVKFNKKIFDKLCNDLYLPKFHSMLERTCTDGEAATKIIVNPYSIIEWDITKEIT